MNKKLSTLILAAAALLVSCSQDELQNTVNNNEGMKPMTISVALPDGMSTRAVVSVDATDELCFLQILDGNGTDLDGGYYTVYYPEGVISKAEFETLKAEYDYVASNTEEGQTPSVENPEENYRARP